MADRNDQYGVFFICAIVLAVGMVVSVYLHNGANRYTIAATEDSAYRLDKKTGEVWYINKGNMHPVNQQ